jgi:pimeloyl-ACP methyl ester carboxylesterase
MVMIPVDGTSLAVQEAGRGAPAFVFVHGWACDRSFWQPQFEDLSRDHRCISIDLRGRGESPAMPPYHVAQQADDVAAVIRALGLGPSIVVGHSLGGLVALVLNERHPDTVLGIVAGDSPITAEGMGAQRTVNAIREAGGMAPAARFVESFFTPETSEAIREKVRSAMLSCPADVAAGMLEDTPDDRMTELVKLADKKPFMALWAGNPLGAPAWLRDVAMYLRQEMVPGTGHFFQLEEPAMTNALLRAFLDDVERDPRIRHA